MFKFLDGQVSIKPEVLSSTKYIVGETNVFAFRKDKTKDFNYFAVIEVTDEKIIGLKMTEDLTTCRKKLNFNCKSVKLDEIFSLIKDETFAFVRLVDESTGQSIDTSNQLIGSSIVFVRGLGTFVENCPYMIYRFDMEEKKFFAKAQTDLVPDWELTKVQSFDFQAEDLQELVEQGILEVGTFGSVESDEMNSF